jgi:hypothetical protein
MSSTRSGGGPPRSISATPAATDSCRRPAPGTTVVAGGSQEAARTSATRSGATTSTIRSMAGRVANAARVQSRSGRPPIGAVSLSAPPIRVDRPAATTTTSAPGVVMALA